jgi:ring-1,2-phenylacetyl-CoA epoxidase subunit PaaC
MASPTSEPRIEVVADTCFIASHRLTEWVSNAPTMEEDVAIGNIALDLLGQARGLFATLGDEDQLAYFRDAPDWHHPVLCELPNGDFGHTVLRQFFLDVWLGQVWRALATSGDAVVRGVAEKATKENAYHRRHSSTWVIRLGDGTEESHRRMAVALDALWPYTAAIATPEWLDAVNAVLAEATLETRPLPSADDAALAAVSRGERGHLVELLSEMQSLARAHPGATW